MPDPVRRRIGVVTADVLGAAMAGPAIRAVHIAEALAAEHEVVLVSTAACTLDRPDIGARFAAWPHLRAALGDVDVVVVQGFVTYHAPWLLTSDVVLVVDLYDPMHFEQLEQMRDLTPMERDATLDLTVRVLNAQLVRGDHFLCASREQRHLWLGALAALGRVNPLTYDTDSSLRSLIDVVPFGLEPEPPRRTRAAIKGAVPGIGPDDTVVLWAGGVYNWFDPVALIEAVGELAPRRPDLRLFFLGMKHPNPDVPRMAMAYRARSLADERGLTGTHVFFNDGWVDYDDRQNYLLDADLGASIHLLHVETEFSFRTRILDYLWAGLPIVTTEGDSFARLVAADRLGAVVPEGDVTAIAAAIESLCYDPEVAAATRERVAATAAGFTWPTVLAPLVEFCRDPRRAADVTGDTARMVRRPVPPRSAVGRNVERARALARQGGPALVVERVRARLRRVLGERRSTG